jgi:hypothetical protein
LVKDSASVRLDLLVLRPSVSELPLPNRFCCAIDADSTMFSELEKPAPSIRLPVGRSLTVKFTSTWSVVPGTAGVSTLTSSKKPRRSMRVPRAVDRRRVVPAAFHLAHLATHHLVARLGVAADVDAAHIHPTARIDEDGERHLALRLVTSGAALTLAKA